MSQNRIYWCKIRNANAETLAYTIETLIATLSGSIIGQGVTNRIVKIPDMGYNVHIGIGSNGSVYVTSSEHCDREKLKNLTDQVQQLYFVIGHKATMEAMGYQVNINQNDAGDFIVQGVMN